MLGYIDNYDFGEMEAMKYYAPPAGWSEEKKKENVRNKVFSGDWFGAEKKDGYFSCFIKDEDGNIILKTRSRGVDGTFANKYDWVPHLHHFFEGLPNGTCLLGELYLPSAPGSKNITSLLGCLKDKCVARQEAGEKLHFYVFDVLAYNEESYINTAAIDRFDFIDRLWEDYNEEEYVDFAHYINSNELWDMLQELLISGAEGMVITHKNAKYEPGKRPSKTTLKVKQELQYTVDVVIMGANAPTRLYEGKEIEAWEYWQNDMTGEKINSNCYKGYVRGDSVVPVTKPYFNNWAGSFKIGLYRDGELVHFGDLSGLTDEMKEHWRDYVGRVAEVGGMEIFADTGAIRHPKLLRIRPVNDKAATDCTWDQLEQ